MANKENQEGYISKAVLRNVRVAPRKARLVADLIRGRKVGTAIDILANSDKKTAPLLNKLLLSAAANAKHQSGVDVDELFVRRIWVNEARTLKRMIPRAHGRGTPIRKRHSSITVVLDERAVG